MNSRKNFIIIIGSLILLFAFSLLFRGKIAGLLSFDSGKRELFVEPTDKDLSATGNKGPAVNKNIKEEDSTKSAVLKKPLPKNGPPLYTGRDPAEIRPVPEEVKVFTEEQRQQLYATIKTHANTVKSDPTFFEGWIKIGILKKMIGDFDGARDTWEYASLIQPGNSLSYANLGELYWRYLHDFPKAEKNLLTSIKNKPDDFQTYNTLSELYYYSYIEKSTLAEKVLLDGIASNLDNLSVKVNLTKALATLYRRKQEFSKAIAELKKVLEMEPGSTEVAAEIEALQKKVSP